MALDFFQKGVSKFAALYNSTLTTWWPRTFVDKDRIVVSDSVTISGTTQYAANDAFGTVLDFEAVTHENGLGGTILNAWAHSSIAAATSAQLMLMLFDTAIAAPAADNAAFTFADAEGAANFVGMIPLGGAGFEQKGAAGNIYMKSSVAPLDFKCAAGVKKLFGYLVERATYTPASDVVTVSLLIARG